VAQVRQREVLGQGLQPSRDGYDRLTKTEKEAGGYLLSRRIAWC
jgi:hypothetical protein